MDLANLMPRRKTKTYGKMSRKTAQNFDSSETHKVPEVSNRGMWDQISWTIPNANQTLGERMAPAIIDSFSGSQKNLSLLPKSSFSYNNKQGSRSSSRNSAHDEKNIFDVPSSDENKSELVNVKYPTNKKKRKLATNKEDEDTFVYDDDSLQRHVAAETSGDLDRIPDFLLHKGPDASCNRQRSLQSSILVHTKRKGSVYHATNTGELETSIAPIVLDSCDEDSTRMKTADARIMQRNQNSGDQKRRQDKLNCKMKKHISKEPVQAAKCGDSLANGQRLISSPERSQLEFSDSNGDVSISSPKGRSLTPRQNHLWKLLLTDDAQPPTPPSFQVPARSAKIRQVPYDKPSLETPKRCVYGVESQPKHGRQRLADQLNSRDDTPNDTDDMSDGCNISDEDSAEPNTIIQSDSASESSQGPKDQQFAFPSVVTAAPVMKSGGLKATYAQQRSYLTDDSLCLDAMLDIPNKHTMHHGERTQSNITATISTQTNGSINQELKEHTNSQNGMIRSLHELREAGSNARSICEVETILEDIGRKRAGALDFQLSRLLNLFGKLQDSSFCLLFIEKGLDLRLFDQTNSDDDLLVKILLAAVILQIILPSTSVSRLSRLKNSDMLSFLFELLNHEQNVGSVIRRRRTKISDNILKDLDNFCDLLRRSTAWKFCKPSILTARAISLQCLEYLARQARELSYTEAILPHVGVYSVVKLLKSGSSGSKRPEPQILFDLQLSVSLLDLCSVSNAAYGKNIQWKRKVAENVVDLLPSVETWFGEVSPLDSWSQEELGTLRNLVLRLILNLTNNSPEICEAFAKSNVIHTMLSIIVSCFRTSCVDNTKLNTRTLLDSLILAIGSMINLTEWCDSARQLVTGLSSENASFLDVLLQLFIAKQAKTGEVSRYVIYSSETK